MNNTITVIMLPCGGGFVHTPLHNRLKKLGIRTLTLHGTNERTLTRQLMSAIKQEKSQKNTICLHGWSMGGGIILSNLHRMHKDDIDHVIIFAGAGRARKVTDIDITLFHNSNDSVINIEMSEENGRILGPIAKIIRSNVNHGDNNHQCNEFVDESIKLLHNMNHVVSIVIPMDDGCFTQHVYDSFNTLDISNVRLKFLNFTTERSDDRRTITFHMKFSPISPTYRCESTNTCPVWDEIKCYDDNCFPVKTDCRNQHGDRFEDEEQYRGRKLFIYGSKNLYEYIQHIQTNKISSFEFTSTWRRIYNTLLEFPNFTIVNHNLDIDTLHFKWERID